MGNNGGELRRIENVLGQKGFNDLKLVRCVCVCIQDQLGNLLILEEGQDKSWKQQGQLGLPMGTCRPLEGYRYTAIREVGEETFINIGRFSKRTIHDVGDIYLTNGRILIQGRLFQVIVDSLRFRIDFQNSDAEVRKVFSMHIHEFLKMQFSSIRPFTIETLFMIQTGLNTLNGVIPDGIIRFGDGKYTPGYVQYPQNLKVELLQCLS